MKYPSIITTSLIHGTTCALSHLLSEPERIDSASLCSLTGQYIKYGCSNGLLGYIGWRNRFQDSLNCYKFGLWSLDSSAGWVAPFPVPGISCRLRLVPRLTCGLGHSCCGPWTHLGVERLAARRAGEGPAALKGGWLLSLLTSPRLQEDFRSLPVTRSLVAF
jgi:hypothetical protein